MSARRFEHHQGGSQVRTSKSGRAIASLYLHATPMHPSPSSSTPSSSFSEAGSPSSLSPQLFVHDPYQASVALRPCPEWQASGEHIGAGRRCSIETDQTEGCGISSIASLACASESSIEDWESDSEQDSISLMVSLSRPLPTHEIKEIFSQFGDVKVKATTVAKFNWRGIAEFSNGNCALRAQSALNCNTLRPGCVASVWDARDIDH